ncbi:insecticidal delta-endotoxin Cry8Ea1 family protein [Bacillus thuringiensis]|uniref:insecticidal delta-endotoxin Cry8Ea1 family protein n=1 Tax=Bacillus thuringiensis TaxID=1428 RepID=UPI0001A1F9C0|nr:insecticidal delta-endotoxin Cry8Ea1 family protein [Bacillus thuringiensis]EEM80230.1 hypothetical protein bthur0011_57960 [Bacillus thuringiensis serovar huazhongensis BGSC 4BD1]
MMSVPRFLLDLVLLLRLWALANLKGLEKSYLLYGETLKDWRKILNDPRSQEPVRTRFSDTDDSLTVFIPSFEVNKNEILLLAVWAQAANLYLLLLRDSTAYGLEWGFSNLR